jgi:hypothetical protein
MGRAIDTGSRAGAVQRGDGACCTDGARWFWLLGRKPYKEIVYLTGITIWGVIGAFVYTVSVY